MKTSSLNTVGVGSGADAGVGIGVGVGVGAGIVVGVGASEVSRAPETVVVPTRQKIVMVRRSSTTVTTARCHCLEGRERGRLIVSMRNIQQASETVLGKLEYASAHWRRHMSRNRYDNLSCQS